MNAARKNSLRKIMIHAAEFRRRGVDQGTALRFAWAFAKADKFAPVGDVWRITFAKHRQTSPTGEITTREALEVRGGKGGTVAFTSATDGFQIRSFRPEALVSVEPIPANEAERNYLQTKAEAQTAAAA